MAAHSYSEVPRLSKYQHLSLELSESHRARLTCLSPVILRPCPSQTSFPKGAGREVCLRETSRNTAGQSWRREGGPPRAVQCSCRGALSELEVLHLEGRESSPVWCNSGGEAGPLGFPVLGGKANIPFETAGHVFQERSLRGPAVLVQDWLSVGLFSAHRTCFWELHFVKLFKKVCRIFFPQGPAFNVLSVVAACQLVNLLILLHLLCFSQGN